MIQLRKSGVVVDWQDVERLTTEFQRKHCVLLPGLLDPALLDFLGRRLEAGEWRDRIHTGIAFEIALEDLPALNLLHLVANAPSFLAAVREITGCSDVTWFGGRVYRFVPNLDHYDSWHDDAADGRRLVGMSVNLSPSGYEGGLFQLRERESKQILTEIANTGWGNATLFRISSAMEHQVTPVTGGSPKTAFAGWFRSDGPSFQARLRTSPQNLGARG